MECHEQLVTTPSSKSPEELTADSSLSTPSVMSQQSHSHSVRSRDSQQSRSQRLLDEDDSDADPNMPPHQKRLKRAHVLDDSRGSEDEPYLGDRKSSADGRLGSSSIDNHSDVPEGNCKEQRG